MSLPQLPEGANIYVFLYCNLKSAQILHIEAFLTNDLAEYLKDQKYMSVPAELAEHLIECEFDTKIVVKVTDGDTIGKFEVDLVKMQEDGAILQQDAVIVQPGEFKLPKKDDDTMH